MNFRIFPNILNHNTGNRLLVVIQNKIKYETETYHATSVRESNKNLVLEEIKEQVNARSVI